MDPNNSDTSMMYAIVSPCYSRGADHIALYLPDNYRVIGTLDNGDTVIAGADRYGWTMEDYVRPRLLSGGFASTPIGDAEVHALYPRVFAPTVTYKIGVKTAGDREWVYNGLRFTSRESAESYASDLASRWTAVRETIVTEVQS